VRRNTYHRDDDDDRVACADDGGNGDNTKPGEDSAEASGERSLQAAFDAYAPLIPGDRNGGCRP
jgi:hypothetical protein